MAKTRINQCLGLSAPFVDTFPVPIVADRAPASTDVSVPLGQVWIDKSGSEPFDIYQYAGGGNWTLGGVEQATTSTFGITQLATLAELQTGTAPAGAYVPTANDVATVIAGVVVGAVPPASEVQQGIAEIATQVETNAGADDSRIVTPLKLSNFIAAGTFPGVFTDLTATGAVSFTGATGGLTMTSTTASSLGVTGAGIDLTLSSAAGRVVVNGEEAADDAVRVLSAAGGLDVNVAMQLSLNTSETSADSVEIISGGGMDLTATGAAGKDIDIVCTAGSININAGEVGADSMVLTNTGMQVNTTGAAGRDITLTNTGGSINLVATENAALNIFLHANGGAGETIQLRADQGTGVASVELLSDVGGVTITAGLATADAINLNCTDAAGGIDVDAGTAGVDVLATGGAITLTATKDAANDIYLHANGGTSETIKLHADQGTGVASLNLLSDVGGITLRSGLGSADAINIEANGNVAGGLDVDAGTAGVIVDTTGAISLDAAAASNFTVTGAFNLTMNSTAGQAIITSGKAAVDAVQINASDAAGGVDINLGTGGITIDTTGAMSFDGAATSNFTVTGAAADATVQSVGGSVNILASEAAVNAVRIFASDVAGGIDVDAGTGGITVDSTGAISIDAAGASNFSTSSGDLTLAASTNSVNVTAAEAAADAIKVNASAGGLQLLAGGGAGLDTLITNTSGSITISAGESAADAFNLTAGGAASGMNLSCGTGGFSFDSGMKVAVTPIVGAGGATAVNGDDFVLAVDTSGGTSSLTFPAAPTTGRMLIVNDSGGAAAGQNITLNGNGKNIAISGAIAGSTTISTAYGSVILVYNGTFWNGMRIA